jgi:hypothetical protein
LKSKAAPKSQLHPPQNRNRPPSAKALDVHPVSAPLTEHKIPSKRLETTRKKGKNPQDEMQRYRRRHPPRPWSGAVGQTRGVIAGASRDADLEAVLSALRRFPSLKGGGGASGWDGVATRGRLFLAREPGGGYFGLRSLIRADLAKGLSPGGCRSPC